jgi:hypothetical protein
MTATFAPDGPDELLALFLGAAYDLFEDELLGDGTWDGHVTHEARTFSRSELEIIVRRLDELAADPRTDRELELHVLEVLGIALGPWHGQVRTGLCHTASLVRTVLHD